MKKIDPTEERLFLEGIFLKYGYDFRNYAESSLARRLEGILVKTGFDDTMDLLKRLLRDPEFFTEVLPMMTVGTTEAFRDPAFFRALRERVLAVLKTYPTLKIWIAGCSSGEEVYSLAVLLKEEGLLDRTVLYATDINPEALRKARLGIYPLDSIRLFTRNYAESGGIGNPSDYYTADYGYARFDRSLVENVVFSEHNLATDGVFTEAHLILCRNVLIYFNRDLQERALGIFSRSLISRGFLALGTKESVRFTNSGGDFESVDPALRIFQKSPEASLRDSRSVVGGWT